MTPKIISIHTPKAGGTSLLELWKRAYGVGCVMTDYGDPPANPSADFIVDPIGWMESRPKLLPEAVAVVHGHFRPEKYDLVKDAFRLTMLRHPVDNVISIYCYWKKIPPQPNAVHQYFLSRNLDVIGLAQLPVIRYLYSETYFGGWDVGKLDFVGRHETRDADLARLATMLSINIDSSLHLNITDPYKQDIERDQIYADQQVVARLRKLLERDIRFYENVVCL